jgi:hypothetical protein
MGDHCRTHKNHFLHWKTPERERKKNATKSLKKRRKCRKKTLSEKRVKVLFVRCFFDKPSNGMVLNI